MINPGFMPMPPAFDPMLVYSTPFSPQGLGPAGGNPLAFQTQQPFGAPFPAPQPYNLSPQFAADNFPYQNNYIQQSLNATAAIRNAQSFTPAPTGELLGLMDKIGSSFGNSSLLSNKPGFTAALDQLTGIPGGIPGYSPFGSAFPNTPVTSQAVSPTVFGPTTPFNPYNTVAPFPLVPQATSPYAFPGTQWVDATIPFANIPPELSGISPDALYNALLSTIIPLIILG